MSYFILGSNSFAGSSLVNYLLNKNKLVVGVSRSMQAHPVMQPYYQNPNKCNFRFYQYDLNQNLAEICSLIQEFKPKFIIDLAGQGMVAESWQNPAQWYETNIVGKVKLHQYLLQCDFLERYIRVSTPEVYGNSSQLLTEDLALDPSTPYAVSHAAVDLSLHAYYKQYNFPVILTRFANFYGPHQQLYRIIPRTMIYALMNKRLQLHGGGTSSRMFIHGDDVASAIDCTIKDGNLGEVYHFSNGECHSIRSIVENICQIMNVEFQDLVQEADERMGKDSKYEMSSQKAQISLNWQAKISLKEGLINTANWVKSNIDIIKNLPLDYIHKV